MSAPGSEPADRLTITLTAREWNTLMTVLSDAPFRTVAPLIGQIQSQCAMQDRVRGTRRHEFTCGHWIAPPSRVTP
jgi:hypothetical protein